MHKYVYLFKEGNADMRELLGGKGANLAEMTNIGLPVPQGFTITTEACTQYYEDGREINKDIQKQINEYIVKMEEITGKKFGDKENPLLVSVRSGARASMPGMMDTILNLGLNEEVVEVLAENPAKLFGLHKRKGFIKEGFDADLVIVDDKKTKTYTEKNQVSASDYSVFKGKYKGLIESVYLRGEEIVKNGEVVNVGKGEYVKRVACTL